MEGGLSCVHGGCGRTFGNQTNLERHLNTCGYKEVSCLYCHGNFILKNIPRHLTDLCESRFVTCDQCEDEMMFKDLASHPDICPNKAVHCEMCKFQLVLRELPSHQKTCPSRQLECVMKGIGCDFKGPKDSMEEHQKDLGVHFSYFLRELNQTKKELKTEIECLKKNFSLLTLHNGDLTRKMEQWEEENKMASIKIKELTETNGKLAEELNSHTISCSGRIEDLVENKERLIQVIETVKTTHIKQISKENTDLATIQSSVDKESLLRAECVQEQQRCNVEVEHRLENLETKLNSLATNPTKDLETLNLEIGNYFLFSNSFNTVNEMVDILAVQVFGSLELGRDKITRVYHEADLKIEKQNTFFDVEFPNKITYKGWANHQYIEGLLERRICIVKPSDVGVQDWPVVNRCLICHLDPTDGRVIGYIVNGGLIITNQIVVKGKTVQERQLFGIRYFKVAWSEMKSQHTNLKCKFAFLLYRQP